MHKCRHATSSSGRQRNSRTDTLAICRQQSDMKRARQPVARGPSPGPRTQKHVEQDRIRRQTRPHVRASVRLNHQPAAVGAGKPRLIYVVFRKAEVPGTETVASSCHGHVGLDL